MAMGRYDDSGGFLRGLMGLVFAVILGGGAFFLGRLGAETACNGPCESLSELSGLALTPFFVAGDHITWVVAVAVLVGLILWMALASYPIQSALATAMLVIMAFLGALAVGDRVIDEPVIEIDIAELDPPEVTPVVREPEIPTCPAGNYWNGEGCISCRVSETVPAAAELFFSPLRFEAAWRYANDRSYFPLSADERDFQPIGDLVIDGRVAVGGLDICASNAILIVGSASSDGPRGRNEERAARRAQRLADQVAASCPSQPEIFALSIGQSVAAEDSAQDRALTVIGLSTPDGAPITRDLIERELGFVLDSQVHGSMLLSRHDYFPQEGWVWTRGGTGRATIAVGPRPFIQEQRLRADAPAACDAY
jgi:hypothetical protein